MIPDSPAPSWVVTVAMPVLTLLAGVVVARVTARGNQRVTELERELPPYEALAVRTSGLEAQVKTIESEARAAREAYEERTEQLDADIAELREALDEDREWIKWTVVVAEARGAVEHIPPLPRWIDLESDSMRQRRRQIGRRPLGGQPGGDQPTLEP